MLALWIRLEEAELEKVAPYLPGYRWCLCFTEYYFCGSIVLWPINMTVLATGVNCL